MKPEAVIFDMDGVLVDNHHFHLEAWVIFCRKFNIDLTPEEFRLKMFGGNNRNLLEKVLNRALTPVEIKQYADEKELIYRQLHAPTIEGVEGVIDFIHHLKKENIKIAVATAAPRENLDFVLSNLGLGAIFNVTVDDSQVTKGKPDPEIYLKTAALLGVDPGRCIVFEDSLTGISAAQSAGMKVIGVMTSLDETTLSHTWKNIPHFKNQSINDLFDDFN